MPALGADMDSGKILEWRIKPGDKVKRGDIVALVDTDKATIEVEVFESGIVESIIVPEGETVAVGTPLAMIRGEAEAATPVPPPTPVPTPKPATAAPSPAEAKPPPRPTVPMQAKGPPTVHPHLRISPLAMRVAMDLGVDLQRVKGTGPDGAITRKDVEKAAEAAAGIVAPAAAQARPAAPPPAESPKETSIVRPLAGGDRQTAMRKAIAAAMGRSKREIPHYYLGTHIDMSAPMEWLRAANLARPVTNRLLYSALLLKAVAVAARQIPEMNGFWIDGAFKSSAAIHVGVAISLRQGGLIAPAIHDVDKLGLDEIMVSLRELVKRVRAGVLRSSEIADATVTVTSLGEQGVETVFGIIYPPQVALVGFGKIVERPWADKGMVGARPVMVATLAADHRVSDGHRGGLFLAAIDRILQEPQKL